VVLAFRTSNYAQNIYQFGTERLTARDGFTGVAAGYYTPVEQFAADRYTTAEIDNALTNGWINQTEYDETIALKGAGDPA
jgi:hypothetical protein